MYRFIMLIKCYKAGQVERVGSQSRGLKQESVANDGLHDKGVFEVPNAVAVSCFSFLNT